MTAAVVDLSGLWVPIVTPFTDHDELDEVSLGALAERLLADGATGLVALGTTGEPATLTPQERARVVAICGGVTGRLGRGLIVGAGSNSTAGTIDEIGRLAAVAPATAALVVVPYYTRPSQRAIVEHFALVADASPVPVVAYNVPYRTGSPLGAAALLEIGSHPNIIGLKQAVGALDHDTLAVLRGRSDGFQILAGDDAFIVPTILMGGSGTIAAAAHLRTADFVEMVAAARTGDLVRARALAQALLAVVDAGFAEPNPAVWKSALQRLGHITTRRVRRPMTEATDDATAALLAAVERVGPLLDRTPAAA